MVFSDSNRRQFLKMAAALGAITSLNGLPAAETPAANLSGRWPICLFVKFLQTLSNSELAAQVAEMGFQGIEATVRPGGQILPEKAAEELPKLVEALRKHNLEITIMASGINRIDSPHAEAILRTASSLGVKRYRMDYYKYDLNRPVAAQLEELKSVARDLAAMNKELGIQGIYQNHAGTGYVGAGLWDLHELMKDIPLEQMGIAYDTRHTAIESGLSWPVLWNLVQPHLAAVYVKNARWSGLQVEDISLSERGAVGQKIFDMLKKSSFNGPISLHVEYLTKAGVPENLAAIKQDFARLKEYLR